MPDHYPATWHPNCDGCTLIQTLLRYHGHIPKEIDTETLKAVLRDPVYDD